MRMQGKVAVNIRLAFKNGKITSVSAEENLAAVEAELESGGEATRRFREFGLGFHPALRRISGSQVLPYFGYGAGGVNKATTILAVAFMGLAIVIARLESSGV